MTPMVCREVDNRYKEGTFVDDLQDEIAALRREVKRLRLRLETYEMAEIERKMLA
jgi:hypothetical protein